MREKGIDQPQLCAQLLLAHVLECKRLDLYLRIEAIPEQSQLDIFRDLVRRGADGEPIAYLIGRKEFFSLDFAVTADVLIPRPETETLVEAVLDTARSMDGPIRRVLDLCTGCGCVAAVVVSQLPEVDVVATDTSVEALKVAEGNIAKHGLDERVRFHHGDLFDALPDGEKPFDFVMANPPYIKTADLSTLSAEVAKHEPRTALDGGDDGLDVIRRIVDEAPERLADGGWLAMEIGYDQALAVRALYAGAGLHDVRSTRDGLGHERVISGRKET